MSGQAMRPINEIARDVQSEWLNVHYAAKPYLAAMFHLKTVSDKYGADSGDSIVLYFLSNAGTFRGGKAKELKAELKAHIKRR